MTKIYIIVIVSFVFLNKHCAKIILEDAGIIKNYGYPTKFVVINVTSEGEKRFLNYHIVLAEPLDEKIGVIFTLEYSASKNRYVKIRSLKEKNACRAMNAYGGSPWIEIQEYLGIPPKVCPIKPGTYIMHHKELDLNKMTFQAIPIGKVRVNFTLILNAGQHPIAGSFMEITHI